MFQRRFFLYCQLPFIFNSKSNHYITSLHEMTAWLGSTFSSKYMIFCLLEPVLTSCQPPMLCPAPAWVMARELTRVPVTLCRKLTAGWSRSSDSTVQCSELHIRAFFRLRLANDKSPVRGRRHFCPVKYGRKCSFLIL